MAKLIVVNRKGEMYRLIRERVSTGLFSSNEIVKINGPDMDNLIVAGFGHGNQDLPRVTDDFKKGLKPTIRDVIKEAKGNVIFAVPKQLPESERSNARIMKLHTGEIEEVYKQVA